MGQCPEQYDNGVSIGEIEPMVPAGERQAISVLFTVVGNL